MSFLTPRRTAYLPSRSLLRRLLFPGLAAVFLCVPVASAISGREDNAPHRTIDAASFGVRGDGQTNDLPALQSAIDAAVKNGPGTILQIPSGHFRLSPVGTHERAHLKVHHANGLTIQGRKDTILDFVDPDSHGFSIQQSQGVTISSLTLERHPLLFTQGSIRSISVKDKTVVATIDSGYDAPDSKYIGPLNFLMVFVEPETHTWLHDATWPPQIEQRKRLDDGSWLFQLSRSPDPAFVGKPFVIWKNVYRGWGFSIEHSRDVHVQDVAYYAGGGQAGFVINHSEGDISFQHFSVTVPPNSGQRFASAGGAMVFNNRIHLTIDDCDFALTDDDNINMGTNSSHVLAQTGPRTIQIEAGPDRADYRRGDHIQIWDWAAKKVREEAIVSDVSTEGTASVLTLDRDVHINKTGIGPLAEFRAANTGGDIHPARRANEYDGIDRVANLDDAGTITVTNSRFQSLRARNLLIKASHSVIENNLFHDTNMAAILVGPEFYWDEAPFVQDLTIRNNTFQNISGSSIFVAAHTTQGEFPQSGLPARPMPNSVDNRAIRIEGNIFRGFGHSSQGIAGKQCVPIFLRNVDGAKIYNNTFTAPDAQCSSGGRILVESSANIDLRSNHGDVGETEQAPFASRFQHYVNDHQVPGAVFLVATRDKILDEEAIGYADIEKQRPMSVNNLFWIASMTKPFTSVALMMLVEEGKLSIDDPVEKYLPEFRDLKVKTPEGLVAAQHPVLIRELLSHISGMANLSEDYAQPLADRVRKYSAQPLEYQPGTHYQYVNAGINTIGRVVEVVSGMPFERFLQERLLTPLDMNDTTFWPSDEQLSRLAASYQADPTGEALERTKDPMSAVRSPKAFPAGGLFSTAADLLKFCRMLLNGGTWNGHRYITQQSIDVMTRPFTNEQTGGSYGLGWMVSSKAFFHDGAFVTRMSIGRSNGLIEIFLTQLSKPYVKASDGIRKDFTLSADNLFEDGSSGADNVPRHRPTVESSSQPR